MSRVVPWMCREEWLATYQNLYNFDDSKSQVKGIDRVQAWKSRSDGKLPLSIEVTASLVAASVSDAAESGRSPLTTRHALAMAIVRFVNGMVDLEQKGLYARSVQSIADDIGLPDWLVDLRHEATHAELPSLEVLQAGCQFSLKWLRDHYWESQITEIQERDEKLVQLVQMFVAGNEQDKCESEKKKKSKKNRNQATIKKIVNLVCKFDMWNTFFDALVGKLCLLYPSSLVLEDFRTHWSEITQYPEENTSLYLPGKTIELWCPLFEAFHSKNDAFLTKLVTVLLKKVQEYEGCLENALLVRYISCWVYFILVNCHKQCKEENEWNVKAELNYGVIMEVSWQSYSSYTCIFMPLLLENLPQLSDKLKKKLEKFCSLDSTFRECAKGYTSSGVKNYHEILKENYPDLAKHVKTKLDQSSESSRLVDWQTCSNSLLRSVPLGGLVGCDPLDFEQLELSEELDFMPAEADSGPAVFSEHGTDIKEDLVDMRDDVIEEESFEAYDKGGSLEEITRKAVESIRDQIWIF